MPLFHQGSEVVSAFGGSDDSDRTLSQSPRAVSTTPIAVGLVIVLVGLWLLSTAINAPFVDPSQSPGEVVGPSSEPTVVPFPTSPTELIDVYAQSRDGTRIDNRWFTVVDGDANPVESYDMRPDDPDEGPLLDAPSQDLEPDLPRQVGRPGDRYHFVDAARVEFGVALFLEVDPDFTGRVAFVRDADPPRYPNGKAIGGTIVLCLAGATLAGVWTIRRRRWKRALERHKHELEARGYVVD